jgi:hypothetical protein
VCAVRPCWLRKYNVHSGHGIQSRLRIS